MNKSLCLIAIADAGSAAAVSIFIEAWRDCVSVAADSAIGPYALRLRSGSVARARARTVRASHVR